MASYNVELTRTAAKSIERLPDRDRKRIVARIGKLRSDPRPSGSIRLKGSDVYRLRQGDYRILYEIDDDRVIVTVVQVVHRGDAYR